MKKLFYFFCANLIFFSTSAQTTNVNQDGIYSLIVTDNYGCEAFDTIVVTFNGPSLDLGPDVIVYEGDYHTFYVANNYNSCQWSHWGSFNYISVNQVGDYWLKVTDSDGCTAIDTVRLKNKDCTSLEDENELEKLQIFPNPNNGVFTLIFDDFSDDKFSVEIVNSLGKQVFVKQFEPLNESFVNVFEMNSLVKGIYFLNIKSDNQLRRVERFIMQ